MSDGGTRALFDLALLPEGPTSVGFTVKEVLRPLVVEWARDGTVTERTIQGDAMAGVRLWGLAALADGRVLVAADRVSFASRAEATGFALVLYERTAAGDLDLVVEPPPVAAYAAPIDLVEAEDGELVVVGSVGGTRETLVPAAWAVCLR